MIFIQLFIFVAEINEIREKGGIKPIVNLLTSPNETLQAHAAKALSVLSADGMIVPILSV
jgi:hypothetical protein